ncbi:hypothetical protein ELD05_08455 [Caldicellulosiruptor changbaiensis]|uniref:Uncharacterized protein n=1 Tax=Caldicellulosiruptor changbaiensis TaxID=1222016 RepID=A0A3T0D6L7_9FIRM|nr:hypothetical protein [Caldicellulosiruptor changbaiensis]AZT90673.1 hypothetical protein ELD05_08455 [Caldicellulosiruptor changbaiensis]
MNMEVLSIISNQASNDELLLQIKKQKGKDYEYLLRYVKGLLEGANTLFNYSSDQDLIEIAIYQQILAEKWLNYLYKLLKKNPQ